tara:strand:- start:193 stop:657 length:465 start_codon:yes stop_codon:yes gene_type:complete
LCGEYSNDGAGDELYNKPLLLISKLENFSSSITTGDSISLAYTTSTPSSHTSNPNPNPNPSPHKKKRLDKAQSPQHYNIVTPTVLTHDHSRNENNDTSTIDRLQSYIDERPPALTTQGISHIPKPPTRPPTDRFPDTLGSHQLQQWRIDKHKKK